MTAPTPAPSYSCLLPPFFTGITDVEDFLTQIEVVSTLSNCLALTPDPRPHFFSARLTGDALTFHRSLLTTAQNGDYDEHKRLFRQQYKPNAQVLKAQVKSLRQLPGQEVAAFYRTLRELAGKAYTDDAVSNEPLLTTFIKGLAKSVLQWEVRKTKETVVEDALSLALEMQSYLNGQQLNIPAASVNNLTGPLPSQSELFSDLIFTIREKVKRVVDGRSGPPQRGRSGQRPTNRRLQQSESNNYTNQNQRRSWIKNQKNCTSSRTNTPHRGQSPQLRERLPALSSYKS